MGPLDLLNHVLNFLAPALWLSGAVTLFAWFFMGKRSVALSFSARVVANFVVSVVALMLGLWLFGRDGKMATYTSMVLLCATSQWFLLRGWRG